MLRIVTCLTTEHDWRLVAAAKAFGIRGVKFDAKAGTLEDLVRKTLAPADL